METERKKSYRHRKSSQDFDDDDENAADIEDGDFIETEPKQEEL